MAASDFVATTDLEAYRSGDDAAILRQAQAVIRNYCGWHVSPDMSTEIVLDGAGSRHLWLPSLHVIDIAAVTSEGAVLDVVEDLDWSESGYIELRHGCWSRRPRQVVVKFTHGYPLLPEDLIEVAVSIASRAASSPSGATREQAGQVSFQWATITAGVSGGVALLAHEKAILDRYKLPPRA